MSADLQRARTFLEANECTLVLCRDEELIASRERGVKPLLSLYETGRDLSGFCAADRVVGKAAAFLYVLLGVGEVYANVISESALVVLTEHGVKVDFNERVGAIRNRAGTGFCPMEQSVLDLQAPDRAPARIRAALAALEKK